MDLKLFQDKMKFLIVEPNCRVSDKMKYDIRQIMNEHHVCSSLIMDTTCVSDAINVIKQFDAAHCPIDFIILNPNAPEDRQSSCEGISDKYTADIVINHIRESENYHSQLIIVNGSVWSYESYSDNNIHQFCYVDGVSRSRYTLSFKDQMENILFPFRIDSVQREWYWDRTSWLCPPRLWNHNDDEFSRYHGDALSRYHGYGTYRAFGDYSMPFITPLQAYLGYSANKRGDKKDD